MPTATGVTIRTWGTIDSQELDTGISHFAKNYLTNTDFGHASVEITLADTPENWAMVEKYLKSTKIPYYREKIEVKKIFYSKTGGEPQLSDENAYEEDVIRVYFSWWPSRDIELYQFYTLESDLLVERQGTDVQYDPDWEAYLAPERRHSRWWLSKISTLPPLQSLHFRNATETEKVLLNLYQQKELLMNDIFAFHKLASKIQGKSREIILSSELSETEKILFQRFVPEFLSPDAQYIDVSKLIKKMNQRSNELTQSYELIDKQLNAQIQQIDIAAKDHLHMLTQKTPMNVPKIEQFLRRHGIYKDKQTSIKDLINTIDNNEKKANEKLEQILPLINKEKEKLSEIKESMGALKELHREIKNYLRLAQFAAYRKPEQVENERKALLALLLPFFDNIKNDEDIQNIHLAFEATFFDLKTNKRQSEANLSQLRKEQQEAIQATHTLGRKRMQCLIKTHAIKGTLPSHTVNLNFKSQNKPGLNPEKMLQQMAAFVIREEAFKLITNNCSHTVSEILSAGAEYRGGFFKQRAFGGSVVTPQVLYNNALDYSKSLMPGALTSEIEEENGWQNYFANWAVLSFEEAINQQGTTTYKLWNALNALGAGATAYTLENVKALLAGKQKQEDKSSKPKP